MSKKEEPEKKVEKPEIEMINRSMFDAYQQDFKSDSLAAYVYLKYIVHFGYMMRKTIGYPYAEPEQKLDSSISELMQMFVDQVCTRNYSKETSIMHSKVVRTEDAIKLVRQTQNMHLVPSERVIPFKLTREILLENPTAIAVGRCTCRAGAEHACVPPSEQNVCMFIGEPNVSFLLSQSESFRKVTPKEAVKILEESHKAGFIHCAYFEKPCADKFNAICNCCPCCCIGMMNWKLFNSNDNPFVAPSGYIPDISKACNGCGQCVDSCPFTALTMDEKTKRPVVDLGKCMGCTLCEDKCTIGAIDYKLEPSIGDPLDIEALKIETGITDKKEEAASP